MLKAVTFLFVAMVKMFIISNHRYLLRNLWSTREQFLHKAANM